MSGAEVAIVVAAFSPALNILFEDIFKKLRSLIGKQVRSLKGLTEDLEKLESTVRKFQHVLRAAEMKNFKTPETRDWYHRLTFVAKEADGVLDEALDCVEHDKQVCHPLTCYIFNPVAICRGKLGEKIKSVTRNFNLLEDERSVLNLEQLTINRETVSASSEEVFVREEERDKIINILLNHANTKTRPHPFIYAIVGLGGIGKTTLTQFIYNDAKVAKEFDTNRIWVWVSQTFDAKLVMEKIIETLSKQTCKFESLETTRSHLNEMLKGKKFLIVLDDIWNENQVEWNKLKSSLESGAVGSSVLLTTRGSDVASIARVHDQHKITVLSEDQCWQVFKQSAFLRTGELEAIGKQIAKKCGGLPLAANTLGGSLGFTRDVREWKVVRDSPIWELPQEGGILPSLKLSLDKLESHSRNCFTICCLFPKGFEMKKEDLIQLWMANDLIPTHPMLEPEDMGNRIFKELLLKSFFQFPRVYYPTNWVTMHDLMHDLCRSVRINDCFCLQHPDVPDKIPKLCLHLSIDSSYPSNILETLSKSHPSLRTCISLYFNEAFTLKMELTDKMEDLPASVGKFKDLKYLDLCRNYSGCPDSIRSLTKLQTLKLKIRDVLTQLSNEVSRLVNLRHLYLRGCNKLTHLPDGVTRLVNLRHLDLSWCSSLTHLPDGIEKLINLRHLDLGYCSSLTHLPDGIEKLIILGHLNLSHCSSLSQLPDGIGRLTNLGRLNLDNCVKLTHMPDDITGLVNLQHLDLSDCRRLTHLPDGISQLINLEHLFIYGFDVTQLPNGMGQLVNLRTLGGMFSVGRESGQRITELQRMNQLTGSLEIMGLEHVRDAREAEAAILKNKNNLSSLTLIWGDLLGSNESSDKVEGVLEALQPPQSLNEKLVIRGYGGSVFARWMKLLENLVEIELKDCIKCERLPPLGQLPLLKRLTITGMKSLKCIGTEFYGSNDSGSSRERCVIFPSLVNLVFYDMPILEEWQDTEMKDNQQADSCPCIEKVILSGCPKLTSLPSLILSFAPRLEIEGCDKVIVRSLSSLTILKLDGLGTNHVTSLPEGSLQNLDALESLWIEGYKELELSSTDFQHLTKVNRLWFKDMPRLTSLPELQHLHSLRRLNIRFCKNLKMLPQGLQNLTSLEALQITGCHLDLHSRCLEDSGEYWPFIKHIPDVIIQYPHQETPPTTR